MEARLTLALSALRPATVARGVEAKVAVELPARQDTDVENGANVWPDEAAEKAFLAERGEAPERVTPVAAASSEPEEEALTNVPLPALGELLKRLTPETRELLDDLFRAKFVSVRRVPKQALKS